MVDVPDVNTEAELTRTRCLCWKLGRDFGGVFSKLGAGETASAALNEDLHQCAILANAMGLTIPEFPWLSTSTDGALVDALRIYICDPQTGRPGAGLELSLQIHERYGPVVGSGFDIGFFPTLLLFFYPASGGPRSMPPQLSSLILDSLATVESAVLNTALPHTSLMHLSEAVRNDMPFPEIHSRVLDFLGSADDQFRRLART